MLFYPIYKYGKDDFSLAAVEVYHTYEPLEQLFSGSLEALNDYLNRMPVSDEEPLTALYCTKQGQYEIFTLKNAEDFYERYQTKGYSERGLKKDILRFVEDIGQMSLEQQEAQPDMRIDF